MKPFKFLLGLIAMCIFALCIPQSTLAMTTWDGGPGITIVEDLDICNTQNSIQPVVIVMPQYSMWCGKSRKSTQTKEIVNFN